MPASQGAAGVTLRRDNGALSNAMKIQLLPRGTPTDVSVPQDWNTSAAPINDGPFRCGLAHNLLTMIARKI